MRWSAALALAGVMGFVVGCGGSSSTPLVATPGQATLVLSGAARGSLSELTHLCDDLHYGHMSGVGTLDGVLYTYSISQKPSSSSLDIEVDKDVNNINLSITALSTVWKGAASDPDADFSPIGSHVRFAVSLGSAKAEPVQPEYGGGQTKPGPPLQIDADLYCGGG